MATASVAYTSLRTLSTFYLIRPSGSNGEILGAKHFIYVSRLLSRIVCKSDENDTKSRSYNICQEGDLKLNLLGLINM
jgi:hypothetical protein